MKRVGSREANQVLKKVAELRQEPRALRGTTRGHWLSGTQPIDSAGSQTVPATVVSLLVNARPGPSEASLLDELPVRH